MLKRAHLRRYGALGSRLNVQKVRLAGCLRAPPRIWTLLSILRVFRLLLELAPRRRDVAERQGKSLAVVLATVSTSSVPGRMSAAKNV